MKFKTALLFGLCFGLSSCFNGRSAEPNFYTLAPVIKERFSDKKFTIGINRIQIARYLDRPQIVTQKANSTEVNLSETNRWIEPLSDLIARTLTADMEKALPNSTIKTRSIGQENFDYIISVDIIRMDTVLNETAELNAWWMIYDKDEKLIYRQQTSETINVGTTYQDMTAAQSILLGKLSEQIALKIAKL